MGVGEVEVSGVVVVGLCLVVEMLFLYGFCRIIFEY